MIGALVAGITGSGGASLSSYESIATATGTGSSGTITFSSIPSTFKHLQVRIHQITASGTNDINMTMNNDSAANYVVHYLYGTGAAASAAGFTAMNFIKAAGIYDTATTTQANVSIINILDYGSTTKNKTARIFEGVDKNGSGSVSVDSGLWLSTSAVNRLDFTSSSNYATTTTIALYGIKEA